MDLEKNVELPVVDMEGQDPAQVVDINDPDIPPDTHQENLQTATKAEVQVPYAPEVTTPATLEASGIRRSTQVRSQLSTYALGMTVKMYTYAIMQLESEIVLHSDAHMFEQKDIYQVEADIVIAIMIKLSLKSGLKEWG